ARTSFWSASCSSVNPMYMGPPGHRKVGTRYKVSRETEQVGEAGAHAGREAAVHHERVAGHERRVVGREEEHRRRDLVGTPEPSELVRLAVLVLEVDESRPVDHGFEHGGALDEPGAHAVHADARTAVVDREVLGEEHDAAFRRVVRAAALG